jgi:hypothetical protein
MEQLFRLKTRGEFTLVNNLELRARATAHVVAEDRVRTEIEYFGWIFIGVVVMPSRTVWIETPTEHYRTVYC